jgi:hypothetical protein
VISFTPRPLYSRGKTSPLTHWKGGWMGPRAGLDVVEKRKILRPYQESNPPNPDCSARSQSLYRLSYSSSLLMAVRQSCHCAFNWVSRHGGVLGEWRYSSTHSSTSALDGGEWSASCRGRFASREGDPGTHWIGWMDPRDGLNEVVKRKFPSPVGTRIPIMQSAAQRYTTELSRLVCNISCRKLSYEMCK